MLTCPAGDTSRLARENHGCPRKRQSLFSLKQSKSQSRGDVFGTELPHWKIYSNIFCELSIFNTLVLQIVKNVIITGNTNIDRYLMDFSSKFYYCNIKALLLALVVMQKRRFPMPSVCVLYEIRLLTHRCGCLLGCDSFCCWPVFQCS